MAERPPLSVFLPPGQPQNQRSASHMSTASAQPPAHLVTGPEGLLLGDGAVTQNEADILGHALDPHRARTPKISPRRASIPRERSGYSSSRHSTSGDARPWYRRPSEWWMIPGPMISAFIFAATMAPRTEIYLKLACAQIHPEYYTPPVVLPGPVLGNDTYASTIFYTHSAYSPHPAVNIPSDDTRCNSDPVVQAAVAKLVTVSTLIIGILTCLVTGWWGQLSDRRGRRLVLGFAVSGVIISEAGVIFVSYFYDRLPGGYWFLLVSSVFDGLLGGVGTSTATGHAYISDCTEPTARSRVFSLALGLLFVGLSGGPSFGSFLISKTNDLLSVFYVALVGHTLYACFVWFVLPESLTPEIRQHLVEKREQEEVAKAARMAAAEAMDSISGWKPHSWTALSQVLWFLKPLGMFLPRKREGTGTLGGRDWNLAFLVTAYGIVISFIAMYQYKLQYAIALFGWSSVELGYLLSAIGVVRALHLVVFLPIILKVFKPKVPGVALPIEPNEPLHLTPQSPPTPINHATTSSHDLVDESPSSYPAPPGLPAEVAAHFDLQVAKYSLFIDLAAYIGLCIFLDQKMFIAGTVLASFGGGFSPSVQSLALVLTTAPGAKFGENGRTFGALAVVQALGSQILGPAIFGSIYIKTVGTYPSAIFVAGAAGAFVAMVLLLLIRIPRTTSTEPGVA